MKMKIRMKIKTVLIVVLVIVFTLTGSILPPLSNGQATEDEAKSEIEPVYYAVMKGDCLWDVAKKFDVNAELLAEVNSLEYDGILAEGERLLIPSGNLITYRVRTGDTLYGIAERFETSVETLARENIIADPEVLPEGREVKISVADRVVFSKISGTLRAPHYRLWPAEGVVSSAFGPRKGGIHEGLDIAAAEGESIKALNDGKVVFAGERGSYGNAVIINHGGGLRTLYAHASKLLVAPGDYVREGQVIARVGNTGRSTGPHLHLEVLYRGQPLDPENSLPGMKS